MSKFIKVPLTEQMIEDYKECARLIDDGTEKDCGECSLNGGSYGCMGEYKWSSDELIGGKTDEGNKEV